MKLYHLTALIYLSLVLNSPEPAGASSDGAGTVFTSALRTSLETLRTRGLMVTGLHPVYPAGHLCPEIESAFAATTRADGTRRNSRFFYGFHSGADTYVPKSTPIPAIADGTVVHKYEGSGIGGIDILLQHAPADTGRAEWVYSSYKHLKARPPLAIGERVEMGAAVGLAGRTGLKHGMRTHLHLAVLWSPDAIHETWDRPPYFVPPNGAWADPLALLAGGELRTTALKERPDAEKDVAIPFMTEGNNVIPAGSRVIWPFACTAR